MRIIGLTGGIGSGKTTVGGMLAELGAVIVDADEGARAVVAPGQPAFDEVVAAFGDDVVGPHGGLDRQKLAHLVFNDDRAREKLNAITHPRVRDWMGARTAEAMSSGAPVVVLDIPLLYEGGLEKGLDLVVVVWCPADEQVRRAAGRGLDPVDVKARIRAQMPLDTKRELADRVIDNSDGLAATQRQVEDLWRDLTG